MLHGHDVICISSIDWDFIWQGHQEIMATLARHGNRVLFIENTGVRAPTFRDLPRLRQRIRNWVRGIKGFRQEADNLFIYSPVIVPFPYSRVVRRVNRTLLMQALRRWMRTMSFRPAIVWTFLPTPLARDIIRAVDPDVSVYYCIDDFASSSPTAKRIRHSEHQLFREVDLVFVTSQRLQERAAQHHPHVTLFPFGVDFETFSSIRQTPQPVPGELRQLTRPVVGYVGGLHQWVDQELLERAVSQLLDVNFVFIGPQQTDLSRLRRYTNAHFLGARRHEDIPSYIKGFDLGMVPYRLSEYTAHVYPTKLNEYLAMGIPVVATDLPEIRRFNAEFGDIVGVAHDPDGFVRMVKAALADRSAEGQQRRIEIARQNSWQARIGQMSSHIEHVLHERRSSSTAWERKLRLVYRTTRHRFLRILMAVVVIYAVVFRSPLLWWVAEPLRQVEPPRPTEAIIVLAGGVGESGKARQGYQERLKQAVDLYEARMAPRMIVASGYTAVFRETEVMRELATAHGVPPSAILVEAQAASTADQVRRVRVLMSDHGWRTALLVSSPYHMCRAMSTFRKLAPELTLIPTPVARSEFYARGSTIRLEQIIGILHEYVGLLYYWWRGWI